MSDQTKRSILCDACKKELIGGMGIEVATKDFGMQADYICHPPLDFTHHFCGVKCLVKWAHSFDIPE